METHRGSLAVWRKPGKLVGLGPPQEFESPPRRLFLQDNIKRKCDFSNECINSKGFYKFSHEVSIKYNGFFNEEYYRTTTISRTHSIIF